MTQHAVTILFNGARGQCCSFGLFDDRCLFSALFEAIWRCLLSWVWLLFRSKILQHADISYIFLGLFDGHYLFPAFSRGHLTVPFRLRAVILAGFSAGKILQRAALVAAGKLWARDYTMTGKYCSYCLGMLHAFILPGWWCGCRSCLGLHTERLTVCLTLRCELN